MPGSNLCRALCIMAPLLVIAHMKAAWGQPGQGYSPSRTYAIGEYEVLAYHEQDSSDELYFKVLQREDKQPLYACSVETLPEPESIRCNVFVLDIKVEPESQRIRVASEVYPKDATTEASYRRLVFNAVKATEDWEDHKQFLDGTHSSDASVAHESWRRAAVSLERAHEKHPRHLGILRDLVVAYTHLNAFETATERGSRLCVLIPARIGRYQDIAGKLTTAEERTFRSALALLYFQMELYPLALGEVQQVGDDEHLTSLRRAIAAIGHDGFELTEEFERKGHLTTYAVSVYRSKGQPASDKALFHHWYFVTRPGDVSPTPGLVWFTLSSQTLVSSPRYYLYGFTGNSRKVLRIYGHEKPKLDDVKAYLEDFLQNALKLPGNDVLRE